jgi:hypothetical protein
VDAVDLKNAAARQGSKVMRLANLRGKLRRLAANCSVAVLAFGVFLTILWFGSIILIVYYFLW